MKKSLSSFLQNYRLKLFPGQFPFAIATHISESPLLFCISETFKVIKLFCYLNGAKSPFQRFVSMADQGISEIVRNHKKLGGCIFKNKMNITSFYCLRISRVIVCSFLVYLYKCKIYQVSYQYFILRFRNQLKGPCFNVKIK